MRILFVFPIIATIFLMSCTKDVREGDTDSVVGPTANVACVLTPQFSTTGQTIIKGYPNTPAYTVNYSCTQNGVAAVSAQCRNANGSFVSCAAQGSMDLPLDLTTGNYTVAVQARASGTDPFSEPYVYTFGVDRLAPYIDDSVIEASKSSTSFTITFAAIEPTSPAPSSGLKDIQCLLATSNSLPSSPAWQDCSSREFSASNLSPSTDYYVFFLASDNAGNLSTDSTSGISSKLVHTNASGTVDPGTPGVCDVTYPTEGAFISPDSNGQITIKYSCPNSALQNKCYLLRPGQSGAGLANCDNTQYKTGATANGFYEFVVADSPTGATTTRGFNIDTTPPTAQILARATGIGSAVFNIKGVDAGSGIDRFTCAIVNNENGKVYNGAQQQKTSVDAALADKSVACGATNTDQTTVAFNSSVITSLGSYTFYVKAFDKVGYESTPQNDNFTIGVSNGLVCNITNPKAGIWTNSADQNYQFSCDYNSPGANMSFVCTARNVPRNTTKTIACNQSSLPACLTSAANPAITACNWTGNFQTALTSDFYTSGDTIQITVEAKDRANSGAVLSSASAIDTFRLDTVAPIIDHIDVVATTDDVLLTYHDFDPTTGSGLRSGITYKVYEVVRNATAGGSIVAEVTDLDVVPGTNQLRFGPRNFYPLKDYRVDISAYDNVNNTSTQSSLIFPGPNPDLGPSCTIEPVSGQAYLPTSSATTDVKLTCFNPFVESSLETDHTTYAKCRVTANNRAGALVIGDWADCTDTNATLVNNSPFNWRLFNSDQYGSGVVKLEVSGCDSTFTYRCGSISNFTYVYARPGDGQWSAENIAYMGTDTQTQYRQKICNNPAPSGGGLACAVESGWTLGNPTAAPQNYKTEFRLAFTCQSAGYAFDFVQNKCVYNCASLGVHGVPGSLPNTCACESGYEIYRNSSDVSQCVAVCPAGSQRANDGSCLACGSNSTFSNGTCTCDAGYTKVNGICQKIPDPPVGHACRYEYPFLLSTPTSSGSYDGFYVEARDNMSAFLSCSSAFPNIQKDHNLIDKHWCDGEHNTGGKDATCGGSSDIKCAFSYGQSTRSVYAACRNYNDDKDRNIHFRIYCCN